MSPRPGQILRLLHRVDDSPRRIALAFGLGVWIAFFPVLGTHTALALGLAFAFRLSRLAVLLGAYVNNPWTIGPLYLGGTLLGCALLGVPPARLASAHWTIEGRLWEGAWAHLRAYVWPFIVGNTVLGLVGGVAGYLAVRRFLGERP